MDTANNAPIRFRSDEEAEEFIKNEEIRTSCRYVAQRSKNLSIRDVDSLSGHNIRWEDTGHRNAKLPRIAYDGTPFIILGYTLRECHQGPQRSHKKKVDPIQQPLQDHSQCGPKSRRILQPTKKHNCPCSLKIRKVLKFPTYKIERNATKWKKQNVAEKIKAEFSSTTVREYWVYLQMPNEADHSSHLTGELAAFTQNIDKALITKIQEFVGEGVKSVEEMRRHLSTFVDREIAPTLPVPILPSNRRFYPTDRDIRNHINIAVTQTRFSNNDQDNLQQWIHRWQQQSPEDHLFFRAASTTGMEEPQSFLFIHQTEWQKRLLCRYGQEICLLDATYNTTIYDLPLFFLCVNTNVGYSIVASFVLGKETKANIKEALGFLKDWNPSWVPAHFMCDYDSREIKAIEEIFEDCVVYICDFHREQAWERWVKTMKHGVADQADYVLHLLRSIARSETEQEYVERVDILRKSEVFQNVPLFSKWIEGNWLNQCKRWVYAFRKKLINIRVRTTNGLERQHRDLKERFLKSSVGSKSLSGMLDILVNKFIPDSFNRYKRYNIESLQEYKQLSSKLPTFLENRPKKFVQHCVRRLPPCTQIFETDITSHQDPLTFTVTNPDSGITYYLSFQNVLPSCTCPDWQKNHWPCKHMLAVITQYPNQGWESLHPDYISSPCFCLDPHVVGSNKESVSNEESDDSPTPSIINSGSEKEPVENICTIREQCLAQIKNVTSGLYGLMDMETLKNVAETLSSLDAMISEKQEKKDGLPVRHRKKTARKMRNSHKSVFVPKKNIVQSSVPQDVDISVNEEHAIEIPEIPHDNIPDDQEAHADHEEALQTLWNSAPCQNPLLQIGPYVLSTNSFLHLKSTLSDELIDAYLTLISKSRNILYINCVVATAIFQGDGTIHNLLRNENLNLYDSCLAVVNEGGIHWSLVIIEPKTKTLIYINPMGEQRGLQERVLLRWYSFLNERYEAGIELESPGNWQMKNVLHSKQQDGTSCGIYVLKFAENYLDDKSLILAWNHQHVKKERSRIGRKLISAASYIPDICTSNKVARDDGVLREFDKNESAHQYDLKMKKAKRKRSSFIYPSWKKKSRVHGRCQNSNNNLPSQQMNSGITSCQIAQATSSSSFTGDSTTSISNYLSDDLAFEMMIKYLYDIMQCSEINCAKTEHERHHNYTQDPIAIHNIEKRKAGYGLDKFDTKFVEEYGERLLESMVVNQKKHPSKPYTGGTFSCIKDLDRSCNLWKVLYEHELIAVNYIIDVLLKEGLAFLYQRSNSQCSYMQANADLSASEFET